jgi:hypothetical protein
MKHSLSTDMVAALERLEARDVMVMWADKDAQVTFSNLNELGLCSYTHVDGVRFAHATRAGSEALRAHKTAGLPVRKYQIAFKGRQVGALGVLSTYSKIVDGCDVEAAKLKLYDTHEHISIMTISEIK